MIVWRIQSIFCPQNSEIPRHDTTRWPKTKMLRKDLSIARRVIGAQPVQQRDEKDRDESGTRALPSGVHTQPVRAKEM